MIQQMLAIWSLVPLPFLKPAWTSGSSRIYTCIYVVLCLVAQSLFATPDCSPPGSSVHQDSPGKYTAVDCCALLQGIFPTQGLKPGLPHCRWILYNVSYQGSPYICIYPHLFRDNLKPCKIKTNLNFDSIEWYLRVWSLETTFISLSPIQCLASCLALFQLLILCLRFLICKVRIIQAFNPYTHNVTKSKFVLLTTWQAIN